MRYAINDKYQLSSRRLQIKVKEEPLSPRELINKKILNSLRVWKEELWEVPHTVRTHDPAQKRYRPFQTLIKGPRPRFFQELAFLSLTCKKSVVPSVLENHTIALCAESAVASMFANTLSRSKMGQSSSPSDSNPFLLNLKHSIASALHPYKWKRSTTDSQNEFLQLTLQQLVKRIQSDAQTGYSQPRFDLHSFQFVAFMLDTSGGAVGTEGGHFASRFALATGI